MDRRHLCEVPHAGRIVSVAVIVAVRVNVDSRREVLGMDIGPSEAETFWTAFVKLVVSDAHEDIKAAVTSTGEGRSRTIGACAAHVARPRLPRSNRRSCGGPMAIVPHRHWLKRVLNRRWQRS